MLRWLIRLIWTLMVFVVLAVGALFLMPVDRIAKIAADQIAAATGRDVRIEGDVSLTLWPVAGASIGALSIANADWSEQGAMLEARDVSVGIDASALLSGAIQIKNISATSPIVRLQTRADGRASWDFGTGSSEVGQDNSGSGLPEGFSLDRFSVTDATFIYEAEGAEPIRYSGTDMTLALPDQKGPLSFEGVVRPAGVAVEVSGRIDAAMAFLEGAVQPIDVRVAAAGSTVSLLGRASLSGDFAGSVSVKSGDTDGLMTALGLSALELPAGLGQTVSLDTDITFTGGNQIALRSMTIDLGAGNVLSGDVDLALSDVPSVTANLRADQFDVSMLTDDDGSSETSESGWSRDAIDASGLSAFNGSIAFRASSVDLGLMRLGATNVVLTNERARMVVDLRDVQAYDGKVSGEFVMNNRSGLSVGGALNFAGLQAKGLLEDFAEVDAISGLITSSVSFLGVGQSLDAIMRSLRGDGTLRLVKGRVQGFNLDQLMRTGKFQGGTTVFNDLNATFTMQEGNLFNSDLFATLEDFEARGEGRIGLGAQDIDYTFIPKALRLNKAQGGLAIPVRLQGPWSDVGIKPDLKAALDLNLDAEKERLERELKEKRDRAEQELKAKLEAEKQQAEAKLRAREAEAKRKLEEEARRKLNLQTQAGQSAEDALKDKLEEKAGKALRSLFD